MEQILANYSASISEFKKSPTKILKEAGGESVAILNHNEVGGYFVPSELYKKLIDLADDYLLGQEVEKRASNNKPVPVSLDEL
jgi:antitoxin StbD